MTENDDKLILEFFKENKADIQDNGFSEHVMRRLPARISMLNRIWTIICSVAGVAFFLFIDGIDSMRRAVFNIFGDVIGAIASIDLSELSPIMIILTVFTFAFVVVYNLIISEY